MNEFEWLEHVITGASAGLVVIAWLARNKILGYLGKKPPTYVHGEHTDRRADRDFTCVFHERFEEEVVRMDEEAKKVRDTQIGVVIELKGLIKSVDERFEAMTKLQESRHNETKEALSNVQATLLKILTK